MKKIEITRHVWRDGVCVSIPVDIDEDVQIKILSKDKAGRFAYPGRFFLSREKLRSFAGTAIGNGSPVRIVPISAMELI